MAEGNGSEVMVVSGRSLTIIIIRNSHKDAFMNQFIQVTPGPL